MEVLRYKFRLGETGLSRMIASIGAWIIDAIYSTNSTEFILYRGREVLMYPFQRLDGQRRIRTCLPQRWTARIWHFTPVLPKQVRRFILDLCSHGIPWHTSTRTIYCMSGGGYLHEIHYITASSMLQLIRFVSAGLPRSIMKYSDSISAVGLSKRNIWIHCEIFSISSAM